MMKKYFFLLLIPMLVLTACGSGAAKKSADEFHKKLDAGEYEHIVDNMIYEEDIERVGREEWLGVFQTVGSWGEIKNRQKESGFSSKVNNGITTCKFKYSFDTDMGKIYESLVMVDHLMIPRQIFNRMIFRTEA